VAESRPDTGTRIEPLGDSALLVTLGNRADPVFTARARAVAAAIDDLRAAEPGLGRAVPAHASVLVPFDPVAVRRADVHRFVASAVDAGLAAASAAGDDIDVAIEIPVRYGGSDGLDLDDVAKRLGIPAPEVIRRHAAGRYSVLFLGFAPGFAYLGGLPPELVTPRRATPRERVPAGSVAIAGEQTAVYPRAMPGGWNVIGRTDAILFDPAASSPARLRPGATVRFVDVS